MAEKLIPAPSGTSNLTPETFLEVYGQWRLAKRGHDETSTAVARVGKKMADVGIDKAAFQMFEKLSKLEADEATTLLKTVIRYGSWAGRGFATQQDMFAGLAIEQPKESARAEHAAAEVENAGYVAGWKGEKADINPFDPAAPDSPNYVRWMDGWNKGQAAKVQHVMGGDDSDEADGDGQVRKIGARKGRRASTRVETTH
ncbi:hypothetical protein UFOVP469_45 [uncultured Caudovirales phage]|uniref:Uncharacterized protein n=1 Tax=uncultured Caudovirales phage TaxID=2100421 RepID=A0A6J5MFS3_9CAUD|nr:hypothetical protein UFOVP469_45 [uncultured Caudovirales phage]CAB4189813.1 hypothetical protein UFOVP1200_18 [uncultured Caudovirales phage]